MSSVALRRAVVAGAATVGLLLSSSGAALASTSAPAASAASALSATPAATVGSGPSTDAPDCAALAGFEFESTTIIGAEVVPAGTLSNRGEDIGEHCLVTGQMNERTSPVDGEEYAIGFEMRLPKDWSGQYLYQANGGMDGSVSTAVGQVGGGESGLQMGMAVISSDAGHTGSQNPTFGLDPQARLDFGYQAVGTLTPMAKALVEEAYGSAPEYSYLTGGSNGGRHTMVGASRYADEYDGFLALAPGFNLPQAAVAQLWGAQQWNTVATSDDLNSALTPPERVLLADAILAQCDELDGLADGLVQDQAGCGKVFSVADHVPTCEADRDGTCLSEEQKSVVTTVFAGATASDGTALYSSFPYDPGLVDPGWGFWKFNASIALDPMAVGYIFSTLPYAPALNSLRDFVLDLDIDEANASIYATEGIYTESAMEFMTPPDLEFNDLKASGGKMMVIHGASDGVFSSDDTSAWYRDLNETHGGDASDFVQYYEVPGMGHVSGGPATDQHDALAALASWVEDGDQPERLEAWVNPANDQVPEDWSSERSRPLCVYPAVATYTGGDAESAASFDCVEDTSPEVPDFSDNLPGSPYYAPVQWMARTGLSLGYADGTFRKSQAVTRAETAAFLYRYMGPDAEAPEESPFSDVSESSGHFTAIAWAATEDITRGYADGTFRPANSVTRGEFATLLYRLEAPEHQAPATSPFKDLSVGGSNYEAITWLASEGISLGDTDGSYNQTAPVSRGHISAFLQRYDAFVNGD
ncbi:tannase/feruloyl esterase family alpha/beta hydrolase [Citricoccus muralis]|uniref:Feruloyl esterase n=1 Tax=Citricoccus muralis TaxID=169134 RepID=A0A3D9LC22_9MICC|nr:tannase/feruloyl esterase family alpha/beta hydrolase [Citricoccus muralis]REE03939.1 feruloyl esterase [Citricoccus muralis]